MNESTPAATEPLEPVDAQQAIWQLRSLVCGLGALLLLASVALNVFVWMQNSNNVATSLTLKQQLANAEARLNETVQIANDLATFSKGKPELIAVFSRHGMELIERPAKESPAPTP